MQKPPPSPSPGPRPAGRPRRASQAGSATLFLCACLLALLAACAGSGGRAPATGPDGAADGARAGRAVSRAEAVRGVGSEHEEERALLLLLADRQTYEPLIVRRCLAGPPSLREALAVALGRSGDPRGLDPLLGLLLDDEVEVQRAAAFALGELGERLDAGRLSERRRAAGGLLDAVAGADRDVGTLAVEALGKLGVTVEQVLARMKDLDQAERWARLLPSLYRFPDPETPGLAQRALDLEDPELVEWAAFALTDRPRPETLDTIRALAADPPSPRVAAWAARALGIVGRGGDDLDLLRPMLDGSSPGATIEALRAARALIASGRVAAPDAWRDRVAELLEDPRTGVRLTALDAASAWLLDERLGDLLVERVRSDAIAAERGAALVALASARDPRAEELTAAAAGASAQRLRARAAEAAGYLGATEILSRLADDPEPRVRQAVLAVRLGGAGAAQGEQVALHWVDRVLPGRSGGSGDPDGGVRAVALNWLADHPLLSVADLETPLERALGDRSGGVIGERLAALDAIAARARRVGEGSTERETAVTMLLEVAADAEYATRAHAADRLVSLGLDRPAIGAAESHRTSQIYRRILAETRAPRTVAVETARGTFRLRLACPQAPLTCLNFLQLADQGFYDGLPFHRLVPGAVIQGGDPRGDGWGGPGYAIRDEIGRLRFGDDGDGGVLGMARQFRDTAGSQFFITLAPRPDLDGKFTAFGRVVEGRDVLGRLLPGDRIESIREVPAGGRDDG